MEPRCDDCAYFTRGTGVYGTCENAVEKLRQAGFYGVQSCVFTSGGKCKDFDPSEEAMREEQDELIHMAELGRESGRSYPASLR